jgi:hypothetical protein
VSGPVRLRCAHNAALVRSQCRPSAVSVRSSFGRGAVTVLSLCCQRLQMLRRQRARARQQWARSGEQVVMRRRQKTRIPIPVHCAGMGTMEFCEARNPENFGLERETGFEPATHCLGSNCATTAPLPRNTSILPHKQPPVKCPCKVCVTTGSASQAPIQAHAEGSEVALANHERRIGTTCPACIACM